MDAAKQMELAGLVLAQSEANVQQAQLDRRDASRAGDFQLAEAYRNLVNALMVVHVAHVERFVAAQTALRMEWEARHNG